MSMTKKQAQAILQLSAEVLAACEKAEQKLKKAGFTDLDNAKAYWLAQLRAIANGNGYASMPIGRAAEVIDA